MDRRSFLVAAGSVPLAGCTVDAGPGDQTATSGGGDGEETTVDEFVAELENEGITVDSTMTAVGSLSVMYYYRPEKEIQDLTRIAVTYAEHVDVSESFLALTALEPDGESRYATYQINEEWARQYSAGDLSKEQYVANVRETEVLK